jgi:hypothetical protein
MYVMRALCTTVLKIQQVRSQSGQSTPLLAAAAKPLIAHHVFNLHRPIRVSPRYIHFSNNSLANRFRPIDNLANAGNLVHSGVACRLALLLFQADQSLERP